MMSHGNPHSATSLTATNGKLVEGSKEQIHLANATGPLLPVRINGGSSIKEKQSLVKKLGTSSTAFIGPVCRPPKPVQRPPKPKKVKRLPKNNIEETLSEFYKELEEIEPSDYPDGLNPVDITHNPPTVKYGPSASHDWNKPNHMTRPHWHDNEPYQPRRPITSGPNYGPDSYGPYFQSCENHWQPPPPFHCQPYPMFHRPPHSLPPPPPIPGLPPPPPAGHQYHPKEDCSQKVPPSHRFPAPDGYSKSFDLGVHGFPSHNSNRDGGSYGWHGDRIGQQSFPQHGSSEWQQRFDRGPVPRQQENNHQQPEDTTSNYDPSLVLILMRGAPGSGKSTRARELLSTGSNGLVLSTDDYFSQENGYLYDPGLLGEAHNWNQIRVGMFLKDSWRFAGPIFNVDCVSSPSSVLTSIQFPHSLCLAEPDSEMSFSVLHMKGCHPVIEPSADHSGSHVKWHVSSLSPVGPIVQSKQPVEHHGVVLVYKERTGSNSYSFHLPGHQQLLRHQGHLERGSLLKRSYLKVEKPPTCKLDERRYRLTSEPEEISALRKRSYSTSEEETRKKKPRWEDVSDGVRTELSPKQLMQVAKSLGKEWKQVSIICLGLTLKHVEDIQASEDDVLMQRFKVLERWKADRPKGQATAVHLLHCLQELDDLPNEVSQTLQDMMDSKDDK
ncbi:hypothetical protein DPEC_G00241450 [Dallia pectoralis]|uniref:Uncharacterized protein n=1 Tax=Dallia pectoralis TaxID=75939 RepID=A0ACC2FUN8_DALPE|nr:hypothetical protein DPEC_G00241450 [Dallia pectoralis]